MTVCPLCHAENASVYARAQDIEYKTFPGNWFDLHKCSECDILYIDPMLSDRLGDIYPPNYYSFTSAKKSIASAIKERLDAAYFRRTLRGISGETLSALDVGGGTGWLLEMLRKAEPRVESTCVVDIDDRAQRIALAAGHDYFLGRIEDFDRKQPFDVILMLNLIEHVSNPRAVLEKARSLLAANGRLFLKTPNFDALDARLFRRHSWAGYHCPRHFVLFTKKSLCKLCDECGLQVQRFSYTQGAPFWSISVLDLLRRMHLVQISSERPAIYHPLTPLLQIAFAGVDFIRRPISKLSQMQLVLTRAH